jgi:hypothetical protein
MQTARLGVAQVDCAEVIIVALEGRAYALAVDAGITRRTDALVIADGVGSDGSRNATDARFTAVIGAGVVIVTLGVVAAGRLAALVREG